MAASITAFEFPPNRCSADNIPRCPTRGCSGKWQDVHRPGCGRNAQRREAHSLPGPCHPPPQVGCGCQGGGRTGVPVFSRADESRAPAEGSHGVVIIDESHHFRTKSTKRYAFVADWLVSRSALLVTATPIVNFLSDLGNQLLLAVRDNALAFDGIQSLRALFSNSEAHPALGHLVIESCSLVDSRPRKTRATSAASPDECRELELAAGLIERLQLSRRDSIARLIRGVLLRAAGSSPAALFCSLRRYRRLLLHARDAMRSGRILDRTAMRRFTAELGDQLVWWELLSNEGDSSDLELADLDVLEEVIPSVLALTA